MARGFANGNDDRHMVRAEWVILGIYIKVGDPTMINAIFQFLEYPLATCWTYLMLSQARSGY